MLVAHARPQDYDDYEQPQTQPQARPTARNHNHNNNHQQPQHHQKSREDDRETTTWIPIIQYDKEQSIDGSYKTQ